ncbi:MAG: Transcriptional regulator, AcrR family [Ktedonobacterales bacterium]|jgi:AcrR family transcriptional regulator|nr:MAG: Transcriptional regulator, AcrR family [Ktedonobacterales bacterium]
MNQSDDVELPVSLAAAWGVYARPTKGPKPGLSLDRIIEATIKVALTDGLGAVSMNRVAADLGTAPMSLYRYVGSKDELLALSMDAALGAPAPQSEPEEGWREGLSRFARAIFAAYRRHPWTLRVPISGPPITPNQIAWLERGLSSLRETKLTEAEKISVITLISGFARNAATLEATISAAILAAGSTVQATMVSYGRLLRKLTDAERFPALHAAIASGAIDTPDAPDDEFTFGLERILDGIAALMRTRC